MTDYAGRADANIAALWELVTARIDGTYIADAHFPVGATGIPAPPFNGAIVLEPLADPTESLHDLEAFMNERKLPYLVWVREGVDDQTVATALARGYRVAGRPPGMVLESLERLPAPPAGVRVERVVDESSAALFREVFRQGFDVPAPVVDRLLTLDAISGGDLGSVVLFVDGVAAACALIGVSGETAGIYNVATAPAHRRRGLGAAATWEAIRIGAELGCTHAVLQASEMGRPVYQSMGFVEIGDYLQLEGPRSTTATPMREP